MAATTLHDRTAEILGRVSFGDEEIVVTKSGKPIAAIVPLWKLDLIRAVEDRIDISATRAARKEAQRFGTVSHAEVKAKFRL